MLVRELLSFTCLPLSIIINIIQNTEVIVVSDGGVELAVVGGSLVGVQVVQGALVEVPLLVGVDRVKVHRLFVVLILHRGHINEVCPRE